jgi:hypothetical protein
MENNKIFSWLIAGDISIQYQAFRDLAGINKYSLQKRIEKEGWGARLLQLRKHSGYWENRFYLPKWTSTHYTLLDLRNLNASPSCKQARDTIQVVVENEKGADGGVYALKRNSKSDVCVNGMLLNYACYFHVKEENLKSIVDFLLKEKMLDGGFNCRSNNQGAVHSSLHTTLSVLEGILEYKRNGYTYRLNELMEAEKTAQEFILLHRLFRSDKTKTGNIINSKFLILFYPCRWYYDILKALDYFRDSGEHYDKRMEDALQVILSKRTEEGLWKLPARHNGQVYFEMEKAGTRSRWNTLRALRVLKHFGKLNFNVDKSFRRLHTAVLIDLNGAH